MIFFAGLLLFAFLFRLWLAAFGGVHPDEAYYWLWSEYPQMGYFDHPPMIAWLIKASRWIVPHFIPHKLREASPLFFSLIEFRFLPFFLSSVITPLIIGKCIEKVQQGPLTITQMFLLMSAPIFFFGPQVITPDTPFFACWALCLYFAINFQLSRPQDSFPGDPTPLQPYFSCWAGLALALAAYSKYSAILAAFLLVISGAGLINSVYIALISFILILPHIFWNLKVGLGEGAGIFFQLQNGVGTTWAERNFKRMGDLWASQFIFWNPVIFISCIFIFFSDLRKFFVPLKKSLLSGTLLLWTFTPLIFFSLTGLKRPAEGNWPLIGIVPGMVLVLSRFEKKFFFLSFLVLTNVATSALGILILTKNQSLADWIEPLSQRFSSELRKPSRIHEFQDWESLHALVFEATRSEPKLPIEVLSYQTLSELLFFDSVSMPSEKMGSRLKIWAEASRRSQYHILPEFILPTPKKSRWLVTRSEDNLPADCKLSQQVYKGIADPRPFSIYKCLF